MTKNLKELYEDLSKIKDDLESRLGAMSSQLDNTNGKIPKSDDAEDEDTGTSSTETEEEYEPLDSGDSDDEDYSTSMDDTTMFDDEDEDSDASDDEPVDLKDVPSAHENIPQHYRDAITAAREEGKNNGVPKEIVVGFHTKPGKKAFSASTGFTYWKDNDTYFRAKAPEEQPEEVTNKSLLRDVKKAIG